MKVKELIQKLADRAEAENVAIDGKAGGSVHQFVVKEGYPHEQTFYMVFLLTTELTEREARREGFKSQSHRVMSRMTKAK